MGVLKKIAYKILCNNITGSIILFLFKDRIPDMRWKGFSFSLDDEIVTKTIIASVFWGFYEGAEIRFAEKYFNGTKDVVEMGGSCGVVTAHLTAPLQSDKRIISVEANKKLRAIWEKNTKRHNTNKAELILLNNAIHYGSDSVCFQMSNNTTESGTFKQGDINSNVIAIDAITLSKIVDTYKLKDYVLVCDIEGSEVEVFLNETIALDYCSSILIELHPIKYTDTFYSIESLVKLIENRSFTLKDCYGPVHFFENKRKNNFQTV